MSFALRDFYLNGGTRAVVVRLFHRSDPACPDRAELDLKSGGLTIPLEAATEGR